MQFSHADTFLSGLQKNSYRAYNWPMKSKPNNGLPALRQWIEGESLTQKEFGKLYQPTVTQGTVSKWLNRGWVSRPKLIETQEITGLSLYQLDPVTFRPPRRVA